ncbi:MAG: PilZ domain-containing protein [candidate division Zixibacteria bacterium]
MTSLINEDTTRKIRRPAAKALQVFDIHTKQLMGHTLDLSLEGMKLMSAYPLRVHHLYFCRVPLDKEIYGYRELSFDAECRWCRKNEETGFYNSGYVLKFHKAKDIEIIETVLRDWLMDHSQKINSHLKVERRKQPRFLPRIFRKKKK